MCSCPQLYNNLPQMVHLKQRCLDSLSSYRWDNHWTPCTLTCKHACSLAFFTFHSIPGRSSLPLCSWKRSPGCFFSPTESGKLKSRLDSYCALLEKSLLSFQGETKELCMRRGSYGLFTRRDNITVVTSLRGTNIFQWQKNDTISQTSRLTEMR